MVSFSIVAAALMRTGACALGLLLTLPALAQTAPTISIVQGEAVTFTIGAYGTVEVASARGRADWRPYDVATARQLSGMPIPDAPVPFGQPLQAQGDTPPPPPIDPGRVRVKFLSIAGQHSLLVFENGYGRAIAYRARMARGDNVRATDVCIITPHRFAFEHWPHQIDRLELYDFHFVDWNEGDPIPCA